MKKYRKRKIQINKRSNSKNMIARESFQENDMRELIIFGLTVLTLALSCQGAEPVHTGQDSGKSILDSLADNISNMTNISSMTNQSLNATNITINQTNNTKKEMAGDLWSWGQIPIGYKLDASGKLVKLPAHEEWVPSI